MKRVILFLLFWLTALSMICALAEDAEPVRYTSGGYVYTLQEDGTAQLNLYRGPSVEDLLLPSVLDGYAVTSVYAVGFNGIVAENISGIISVTIPDSIVSIDGNPFCGMSDLRSIIVSAAHPVFTVEEGMLIDRAEMRLISYPRAYSRQEDGQCVAVSLPSGIVEIDDRAFKGCNEELRFIVGRDSAAAVWCRQQGIVNYTYPDANDWLFD